MSVILQIIVGSCDMEIVSPNLFRKQHVTIVTSYKNALFFQQQSNTTHYLKNVRQNIPLTFTVKCTTKKFFYSMKICAVRTNYHASRASVCAVLRRSSGPRCVISSLLPALHLTAPRTNAYDDHGEKAGHYTDMRDKRSNGCTVQPKVDRTGGHPTRRST